MDWNSKSTELWGDQADRWNKQEHIWEKGPRAEMLDFFFETIDGTLHPKVLDMGCGPGVSTSLMNLQGYQALGIDQSEGMVRYAKERDVEAYVMTDNVIPFKDNHFDGVFACTSLEWTDEPHQLIKEIERILKPGGTFVAVTLGPYARPRQSAYGRLYGEKVIHNMMMPWELRHLLEEHGFSVNEMRGAYAGKHMPNSNIIDLLDDNWIAKSALSFLWAFAAVTT
ncbi:class I SAM-dependent methyltransferase [Pseudalkalibacillus salsuginis]|uniref:class I SAM-dependent methyltransferase n=1 Tax=Pseudalkalibacillus salsuginis TaxID=2910972 RepID=UPI001F1BBE34|nr:class I SAM-dependent methyltransferase [Pseudalkalibacillus salsuginis]MCF6410332.1 class I SAM-dependent methyltransferase [Pseudalkalibacillus salsuginis]